MVLQTVVTDEQGHIGVALQQRSRRVNPPVGHVNWRAGPPVDQHRLVADIAGRAVQAHLPTVAGLPTIAARENPHLDAALPKVGNQRDHQRRLAPTARHQIADHQYRDIDPLRRQQTRSIQATAKRHQRAEQHRRRPQQRRQETTVGPRLQQRTL